jgi:predicted RND superfamily exporter protein
MISTNKVIDWVITRRKLVAVVIVSLTAILGAIGSTIDVKTVFDDLLPSNHPFIETHQKYKNTFGSSNVVSLMVEVESGDIFTKEVLAKIKTATTELQKVKGVDQFQVISLAAKKLKEVKSSTEGIELKPLMWPEVPQTPEAIAALKESVVRNPLVYGVYVGQDLKSALITADFIEADMDYALIFDEISKIAKGIESPGVKTYLVGEPILYGWVRYYLSETILILGLTIGLLTAVLFIFTRTLRGTLLPMSAGLISALWSLGFAKLFGFNLDPLIIVVAFLISARSVSHAVQIVMQFEDEVQGSKKSALDAARTSFELLFKPGMLGILTDAACIFIVVVTPIPMIQKIALIATIWVCTIAVGAVVMTPLLLSWTKPKAPSASLIKQNNAITRLLNWISDKVIDKKIAVRIIWVSASVFVLTGIYATNLSVGDTNPGSPILWQDSVYNQDAQKINNTYLGADRLFVAVSGDQVDILKSPEAISYMARLQRYMEDQPEVGGSISMADIIPVMKKTLREGNPRYEEFGADAGENGEIMYLYTSGTDPGDIDRFVDSQYKNASVTFFFKDHQGSTIRTAIARLEEFKKQNKDSPVQLHLAGSLIGILAAINDIILSSQIESIAAALVVLILSCALVYRTLSAGTFFMVPVLISNTLTFAFMTLLGIGMNINTLPIAALGIGLGVDYAIYVVDRIKEEIAKGVSVEESIRISMLTAGRGVLITAATLVVGVFAWYMSSIRFQAEMGLLMALWLTVSAVSSLVIMPALVNVARPRFIVGK